MNNGKQGTWKVKVGKLRDYRVKCWKSGKYRYKLKIELIDSTPTREILVIMLNPSDADEKENNFDPTCRFLINICHSNGYDYITICNLFSLITKDVKVLGQNIQQANDNQNINEIKNYIGGFNEILCAWGGPYKEIKNKKILNDRIKEVLEILKSQKSKGKEILKLKFDKKDRELYPPHPQGKDLNTEFEPYCIERININ